MRICVFGAGSVGGYLAAYLSRGGAHVSVVARGPHLAAIRANGLTVETPDRNGHGANLPASDNPADLGQQDFVLVTVKAPALPDVAATIAPLLGTDTAVAFIMNGIPWWYFHRLGGAQEGRQLPCAGSGWRIVASGPSRSGDRRRVLARLLGPRPWRRPPADRRRFRHRVRRAVEHPHAPARGARRRVPSGRAPGNADGRHPGSDLAQARVQSQRRPDVRADRNAGHGHPHRAGVDRLFRSDRLARRSRSRPPWASRSTWTFPRSPQIEQVARAPARAFCRI